MRLNSMSREIEYIPSLVGFDKGKKVLKRAVGYARVSTKSIEQNESYEFQVDEIERYIKTHDDYQYICVFSDKGTGTNTERIEFQSMLKLARANKIDVIITKSISRFGRNLTDTLSIVNELRNLGIELVFLKENMSTNDTTSDFMLSVLAIQAEEEAKTTSSNLKWAFRKKMQSGGNLTYNLYGYKFTKDKPFQIVESEATVVRKLFDMYINGFKYKDMIIWLKDNNIKSPMGRDIWYQTSLEQILRNEKYCGDMLLQKSINSGQKKIVVRGEVEQFLVENNHEGIISREVYGKAMLIRTSRRRDNKSTRDNFSESSKYVGFVYSLENETTLNYVVEKPKGGKYNIPTLYCYSNNPGSKRRMIRVKALIDMLSSAMITIRKNVYSIHSQINDYVSNKLVEIEKCIEDDSEAIGKYYKQKCCYENIQTKLISFKMTAIGFKESLTYVINYYKKIISRVVMVDLDNYIIEINLNDDGEYIDIGNGSSTYIRYMKEYELKYSIKIKI
jgi:DNA invertase Pin-like site-specific DNA recombinase